MAWASDVAAPCTFQFPINFQQRVWQLLRPVANIPPLASRPQRPFRRLAQRACSQEVWCLGTDWHSCMESCQRAAWKLTLCLCSPLALSQLQKQHHVCLQRAPSSFPSLGMWVCAVCGDSGHVSSSGHTAYMGAQSRCMCDQPAPGALCLPHRNSACASNVADRL
jgi:hypothetical protein